MAITTFTAAQVLLASQLNAVQSNDFNQTVSTKTASYTLVALDKGTRVVMNAAGATTITINTSLFSAGDTLVLQNIGAGVTTVTAGTATVSSAGPLAIPQNGSGTLFFTSAGVSIFYPSAVTVAAPAASGLTLITATTIGTTVASVTVTSAFSATYDNYKIIVSGGIASTSNSLNLTLGATTTGYYRAAIFNAFNSSAPAGSVAANTSSFTFVVQGDSNSLQGEIDIFTPNLAKFTHINNVSVSSETTGSVVRAGGMLADTTQYTAFTLTASTGTITGGTIRVYGYQNS